MLITPWSRAQIFCPRPWIAAAQIWLDAKSFLWTFGGRCPEKMSQRDPKGFSNPWFFFFRDFSHVFFRDFNPCRFGSEIWIHGGNNHGAHGCMVVTSTSLWGMLEQRPGSRIITWRLSMRSQSPMMNCKHPSSQTTKWVAWSSTTWLIWARNTVWSTFRTWRVARFSFSSRVPMMSQRPRPLHPWPNRTNIISSTLLFWIQLVPEARSHAKPLLVPVS